MLFKNLVNINYNYGKLLSYQCLTALFLYGKLVYLKLNNETLI
jgi:hypothetical protein